VEVEAGLVNTGSAPLADCRVGELTQNQASVRDGVVAWGVASSGG
jgi:hypothetical protein